VPYAQSDGVRLYYEETGTGHPIVFVHEFGADHREWEAQVRWFAREYRCIAFAARGYPPSDVPEDETLYGQDFAVGDIAAVMRHCGVERAHLVGCSMGSFAALLFAIRNPRMTSTLVLAGVGSGSTRSAAAREEFRRSCAARGEALMREGWDAAHAEETGHSPTRIQFKKKDPRGWAEYMARLRTHSGRGSGLTMKRYQGMRDSIFEWEDQLKALQVPTLLAVGDEDAPCLEANLFLKQTLPNAGLWVAPRTGHAINLEEPAAFNAEVAAFFSSVERGRWPLG
jgi:pimeloyl-ACP methyl ester carboxylesterase